MNKFLSVAAATAATMTGVAGVAFAALLGFGVEGRVTDIELSPITPLGVGVFFLGLGLSYFVRRRPDDHARPILGRETTGRFRRIRQPQRSGVRPTVAGERARQRAGRDEPVHDEQAG